MNYTENPTQVAAYYDSHEYLMQHWAAEEAKLDQWAALLNLQRDEYIITKPPNQTKSILVDILKPLQLEEPRYDASESEPESEYESD